MRTRPGWVEPEVYFRIVHVAGDGHHDAPLAAYREQTVEIALASVLLFYGLATGQGGG